ncbi:MAG: dephospho-CoA kinase [Gemmatimonadetes bacterium]|nr:dephospho-CoA kinase [Gemmatimonadota bacterium]
MIVIGIAGGIASGKSTAARVFEGLGARVLDADAIGHDLLRTEGMRADIRAAFGDSVLTTERDVDRRALGRLVFGDEQARQRLNRLVRPAIRAEIRRRIAAMRGEGYDGVVVVDAPLLVDTGPTDLADRVILVTAPASTRKERIILRGLIGSEAEARIAAQEPDAKQARWADYILENDGTRDELIEKAEALWKRIVS